MKAFLMETICSRIDLKTRKEAEEPVLPEAEKSDQ
jgi:hypothetical protein